MTSGAGGRPTQGGPGQGGPSRQRDPDLDWPDGGAERRGWPDAAGPELDWRADRERWRQHRAAARRLRRDRRRLPPVGCLVLAALGLLLVVGSTVAFLTWVAAAAAGLLIPAAGPSPAGGLAIAVVLLGALVVSASAFARYVRPLAAVADATRRLADGEPGVRVWVRGPRPVRELAIAFNAMADRLDRARGQRQAMLADVTHELRTPLAVIGGGIEAMLDGVHPLDPGHLEPLLAEVGVMDRLLEDLRTLSLAEAGALPLHRETADLVDVAADAVGAQRAAAEARGVRLGLDGDRAVETSADPVRVREIVTNLLTNAIRHTPPGGSVQVTVRRVRDDVVIEVRDTGDGIAAEDIPLVFERFQRRADSGGSGLGLAIVRDLAAAHGGSAEAESAGPGRGSTFRVRLPVRA